MSLFLCQVYNLVREWYAHREMLPATCDSQVPVKCPEYPVLRDLRLRRRAKSFETGRAGWRLWGREPDE
jgi:hypothetical protein